MIRNILQLITAGCFFQSAYFFSLLQSQADLPRLGQEHIETGRYLRQIFPAYGVRVISVNDGVDTAIEQNGDDLHITLKNLLNAPYSRDISVKTRSTLLTKWQNGDYVGSYPIYGCRKARTIKTILHLSGRFDRPGQRQAVYP